jgi:transcriptional regulator with XRE-family HTH domain
MDNAPKSDKNKRGQVVDAAVFVERLKTIMVEKGYSSAELADRADLARSALTQFFTGGRKPSADALVKLANVLDVSTDYLLGRRDHSQIADILQHDKLVYLVKLFIELSIKDQDRAVEMLHLLKATGIARQE